jgi:hypothetical protein
MNDPIKGIGHGDRENALSEIPAGPRGGIARQNKQLRICRTRDALRTAAKSYDDLARSAEEIRRTAEARVVAEEYADDQLQLQRKLRGQMN